MSVRVGSEGPRLDSAPSQATACRVCSMVQVWRQGGVRGEDFKLEVFLQHIFAKHLVCAHFYASSIQSCPTLCHPMDCSTPAFPVHHQLPELAQTHVCQVGDAIQPSHPLLLPPSIFHSIRVSSKGSVLHIRWLKYWSFSFNISPSMTIQNWFPLRLTG